MKLIPILILIFAVAAFPQKKDSTKHKTIYTLKKVTVPHKPSALPVDPDVYTAGKGDNNLFRDFMLMNIYTEQRETNRILQNNEEEK